MLSDNGVYLAVPFSTDWLSTAAVRHWRAVRVVGERLLSTKYSGQNRAETAPFEVETGQKAD